MGYLELPRRQRFDPVPVGVAGTCATVDAVAELAEFALGLITEAQRSEGVERRGRTLKLRDRAIGFVGLGERPAGERSCELGLERRSRRLCGGGGCPRVCGCSGRIARMQLD